MTRALLLCVLVTAATPAWAADRLTSARAEVQRALAADGQLSAEQQRLGHELDTLGARISELKAQGRKLVSNAQLDEQLRHSQELSSQLNTLASQRQGSSDALTRARTELAAALGDELSALRKEWDRQGSHQARAQLIGRMRVLRKEREALLAATPATALPALSPVRASDDPEDLLEQADAARDAQDKVRKRLAALDERISEARQERDLEQRLNEFSTEQGTFDEQDRTLRLNQDPHVRGSENFASGPNTQDTSGAPNLPGVSGSSSDSFSPPPGAPLPPREALHAPGITGAPDDLRALETEKAELERLNRSLGDRATTLEDQARTLR